MLYRYLHNFCRNILYKRRVDEDLDQEIRSYAELVAEAKAQSGISGNEALRQTYRELGGVERIKENVRDVRVGFYMDSLLQDLRYATRIFRPQPRLYCCRGVCPGARRRRQYSRLHRISIDGGPSTRCAASTRDCKPVARTQNRNCELHLQLSGLRSLPRFGSIFQGE